MADNVRIFFALWPRDSVRRAIIQQVGPLLQSHKKVVPRANLHLTLAFIGNIEIARLKDYRQAAETVQASAFDLTLDQVGTFSRGSGGYFFTRPGAVAGLFTGACGITVAGAAAE